MPLAAPPEPAGQTPLADYPPLLAAPVEGPEPDASRRAHRSADRSLLYPSVARSIVGGLVAIAVILSGIVAINLLQRDESDAGLSPAARSRSASTSASAGASASGKATSKPTTKATGKATAPAKPKPAPAAPAASDTAVPGPAESPAAPEPAPTEAEAAKLRIPLTVFNNSRISGLAATAREDFRAAGWPVVRIDGTRYQPKVTTVYYAPGQEASARQLMRDEPRVKRMLPRPSTLPGSGLTVVVTREYVGR